MADVDLPSPFMAKRLLLANAGLYGMGGGQSVGGPSANAWAVANTAYFQPFRLPFEQAVKALGLFIGTGAGSFDLGIYTLAGKRLASTGSVTVTASSVMQRANLAAPLLLGPDAYYMAAVVNNNTLTVGRSGASAPGTPFYQALGMGEMASAFPLPDPATIGALLTQYCPSMALYMAEYPL